MKQRGAILVLVLAALAMLALLGAHAARFAAARERDFVLAWCRERARADRDDRAGGLAGVPRATIGGGAAPASSIEGFHGPQAFSPGRDRCFGHGAGR
jgi:hypothetical protein